MSEWWTYRLSDFLMFSPSAYWRLVERYNREAWPLHLLMLGAGLALWWLAANRRPGTRRVVPAVLAVVWLWVGWAFHLQAYAEINWAARYLALAFSIQALLLLVLAGWKGPGPPPRPSGAGKRIGMALVVAGMVMYPLAGLLVGRPWQQAELFGTMPEPTALATLGLLLLSSQVFRGWVLVIPWLSLAVGWTTLWLLRANGM